MRQLIEIASELQGLCDSRRWRSCVIGGLAVQRWGEPRLTRDVDISLLTGFGTETVYIDALLALYQGRVADTAAFALRNRVLLLQKGGVGIDTPSLRFLSKSAFSGGQPPLSSYPVRKFAHVPPRI